MVSLLLPIAGVDGSYDELARKRFQKALGGDSALDIEMAKNRGADLAASSGSPSVFPDIDIDLQNRPPGAFRGAALRVRFLMGGGLALTLVHTRHAKRFVVVN